MKRPQNISKSKGDDNSSINSNGDQKVARSLNLTYLDDIASSSEAIRTTAYQHIANKYLVKDIRQFISQLRVNSVR